MKNKTLPVIVFFILLQCVTSSRLFGQDASNTIAQVNISSPTASSLGKFGDIPVSYHTGIPQIDIPVYTVESGSLKLPISLSYHASGLKVEENAGWVGAGWALNAGGVITRTVIGSPDDRGFSIGATLRGHYTDYGYNSYLNGLNTQTGIDDIDFCRGWLDGEPDLYFFNFGTYSGKFYFNDDRTPILVPEADFKIQTFNNSLIGFTGFIITTNDGNKYYFGQQGNNNSVFDPIESTIPSTLQNGAANANAAESSWFLNKVVSADGMDSITLSYQAENYAFFTISMFPIMWADYNAASADYRNVGTNLVKNFVSGARLTKITFPNGTITFTPSATPRIDLSGGTVVNSSMYDAENNSSYSLGSITIANNNGFCKKDSFYYGYFFDNTPLPTQFYFGFNTFNLHTDEYRLRLDSMKETSCDQSLKVPAYKFSYFSEFVPRRLSFGVDHWGYSNGASNNVGLIPTFTVIQTGATTVYPGANRDAGWPAMRGGSLQQINYPTGGFTSFDFEPKDIDTFYNSILQAVGQISFALDTFGQGAITSTQNFTIDNNGGAFYVAIHNGSSNWAPTLTITNSSGGYVAMTPLLVNFLTDYNNTAVLPPGTYTATLAYPPNSAGSVLGGATGTIGQWRYVLVPTIQNISGLRIKTITNNDGMTTNNLVTSYNYTGGASKSTGVLYSIPTYVQILRNDINKLVWPTCSPNGCTTCDNMNFGQFNGHAYYVSPSSIRPMASVQGENYGYNEVDVSQTGNGKSVYRYYGSNLWSLNITDVCTRVITQTGTCDVRIPNYPSAPIPFEYMRDELSYEGHFNQNGQVLKETYYYPEYTPDPLKTPGHIGVQLTGISDGAGLYSFTEYTLQSARKTKNRTTETTYDRTNGNSITTSNTVYIGSAFHNQPTRKVTFTSTGDSLVSNTKYAMDYRIASCDLIPDSLSYYNTLVYNDSIFMVTNVVSCTPQGAPGDYFSCRRIVDSTYRIQLSQARMNLIRYRKNYFAQDGTGLQSQCYLTAMNTAASSDTLLKPILRLQNAYANPAIEVTSWKDSNLLHASFIRYDTSKIPRGYAYPGRMKLINLQAPAATFTNSAVSGNTITKDSRYIDESFFNFSNGKPVQTLGKDGLPVSYVWDYLNTSPIAKVSNATVDLIAFTSFEADGKGGWAFSGTPVTDASAKTGGKDYNLSSGNIITSGVLNTAKSYVVSYWSKTGSATVNGSTATAMVTKNGWTYYEHIIAPGASSINITGNVTIDELRLYPTDAQMTSYTYTPLMGMTTSDDVSSHVSVYQYDNLGRLMAIKDQDGNIIKTIEYHYAGQP